MPFWLSARLPKREGEGDMTWLEFRRYGMSVMYAAWLMDRWPTLDRLMGGNGDMYTKRKNGGWHIVNLMSIYELLNTCFLSDL